MFQYLNVRVPLDASMKPIYSYTAYFSLAMFFHIFEIAGVFIFIMIIEVFNYLALMFIMQQGLVTLVALYSTLHATYVILIGLITG